MKRSLEKIVGSYFGLAGFVGFIYWGILKQFSINSLSFTNDLSQSGTQVIDMGIYFAWLLALVLWSNTKKKYLIVMLSALVTLAQGSSLFFYFRAEIFIWLSVQFFLLLFLLYFDDSEQQV